ncbi:MAG: ATP-binding protein, partial [Nocardioidaceae bacterium]|nr:ATP-binding protein [Nocardioidaceae bacterium]
DQIRLDGPLKELGLYTVKVHLHSEVQASLKVWVVPTVTGDADLLYPVALNLLTNVLKFARPGQRPSARIHAERRQAAWRVHVIDQGVGVPAGREDSVFRPWVRAQDGVEGHGIGLATVKRLVEVHAGRVGLERTSDGGTDVWFELPDGAAPLPR